MNFTVWGSITTNLSSTTWKPCRSTIPSVWLRNIFATNPMLWQPCDCQMAPPPAPKPEQTTPEPETQPSSASPTPDEKAKPGEPISTPPPSDSESKKKFTKSYGS